MISYLQSIAYIMLISRFFKEEKMGTLISFEVGMTTKMVLETSSMNSGLVSLNFTYILELIGYKVFELVILL